MRIEDAIKTLKELWRETNDPWYEEVYNMAINALEADRKTEPQKKEVEWVYNKRERLWYPYLNGELLFKDEPNSSEKPNNLSEIPTSSKKPNNSTISKMEQVDKDMNVPNKRQTERGSER